MIQKQEEIMDNVRTQLKMLGDGPFALSIDSLHLKALLLVLEESMVDIDEWISWWLHEDADKTVEWDQDGSTLTRDVSTPGDLYEFLVENLVERYLEHLPAEEDAERPGHWNILANDFHQYFEACMEHCKERNVLHIDNGDHGGFVLMSQGHYDQLCTSPTAES